MHPWLGAWLPTLAMLHVLATFAFVLLHGPSIAAMWRLRVERDVPRVQALLETSRAWMPWSLAAVALLALTGLALAGATHAWRLPWVWGSALVFVAVSGSMSPLAARVLNEARHAAGMPWFDGKRTQPPGALDPRGLEAALERVRARAPVVMLIGVGGLAALVWLMVARPA